MSEFRFICPFCDTPLDCPEELDGVETECPVCHAAIVPTISNGDFSECSEAEKLRRKSYERLEKLLKEQQECSEAEELRKEIDEQWEEFLQEQEQEIYPFIAKCPACKKVIELKEELKYSKQQCPFCNKTVILNTVKNQNFTSIEKPFQETVNAKCSLCKNIIACPKDKIGIQCKCPGCGNWTRLKEYEKKVVNEKIYSFQKQQDYQDLSILSLMEKHNAFRCEICKNITIISKNSELHIVCPHCKKFIKQSEENKVLEQKDDSLTDFISAVKYEAGLKKKKVFFTNSTIQKRIKEQIEEQKKADAISDTAVGCVAIIACIFILILLGSCITSCDTSSSEENLPDWYKRQSPEDRKVLWELKKWSDEQKNKKDYAW